MLMLRKSIATFFFSFIWMTLTLTVAVFFLFIYLDDININGCRFGFGFRFCTAIYMQGFQKLSLELVMAGVNVVMEIRLLFHDIYHLQ